MPQRPDLTRDQKIAIITLQEAGFQYQQIREHFLRRNTDISIRQIQYTVNQGRPTPQKKGHSGRPVSLDEEQVDEIEVRNLYNLLRFLL